MEYAPTIGLEIHAELKTQTKMFCSSKNDPDETKANVNICPVCLAHPGTLPVINREAVKHVLKVGLALGGKLADYTEFDRKNYFYPDLPKGYQISQYEFPLVSGGVLNGIAVTRVHLEEDTASSIHDEERGTTVIDFNRSGVPLMELVTEPVIRSAKEAGDFARELQLLLRYLGASEANMEKGEMRVEANVSVAPIESSGLDGSKETVGPRATDSLGLARTGLQGKPVLGTKVEIKNLNSFRAMERAVTHEITRQVKLLERGGRVIQETRGWDEAKQTTFPQRSKEGSADYRYFPDPDLPSLRLSEVSEFSQGLLDDEMPELPGKRRERYQSLGIKAEDAALFTRERILGAYFDTLIGLCGREGSSSIALAANYLANDLVKLIRDIEGRDSDYRLEIPISALNFKKIIDMLAANKISSRGAKDLIGLAARSGADPEHIARENSIFLDASSSKLNSIIDDLLLQNPSAVADFKSGKNASLQYLIGQAMKASRGSADPSLLRDSIISRIQGQ